MSYWYVLIHETSCVPEQSHHTAIINADIVVAMHARQYQYEKLSHALNCVVCTE